MMTPEDRRKELAILVAEMRSRPSSEHEAARERAWVLSRMLAKRAER